MATSRTGTAHWKNLRAQVIREAQDNGIATCPMPGCGVPLNYQIARRPDSPEVDHIKPHAQGGQDTLDNLRVICRLCNQRRSARDTNTKKRAQHAPTNKVTNLVQW